MGDPKHILVIGAGSELAAQHIAILNSIDDGKVVIHHADIGDLKIDRVAGEFAQCDKLIESIQQDAKKRYELTAMHQGKVFKCKGKHQYNEVNGNWVCECGRNMND